jgi:esterase
MSEHTVKAGGIHWRTYGASLTEVSGATSPDLPLVILHGLFGSGDNWQSHARELVRDGAVLAADLPGHGHSESIGSFRYPDLARVLWASLEELGYGREGAPVKLLGHSMGGKVAMAMAFSRPASVARLVVADIAPKTYPPRHTEILDAMGRVASANPESRSDAERILSGFIPEKPVRLFLLKSLIRRGDRYRWLIDLEGIVSGYDHIRGWPFQDERYDGPSLVIAGGESPYLREGDKGVVLKHLPGAVIETIPGAGHWLHVENRTAFLDLVRSHTV